MTSRGVRRLVDELGVSETVRLEQGCRPIEDVIPVLERASVGVVPIVDDPFTKYMLPVKLLEYVALGMPVIASSTSTIRAHFSDEMLAFTPPGDARCARRADRRAVSRSGQALEARGRGGQVH